MFELTIVSAIIVLVFFLIFIVIPYSLNSLFKQSVPVITTRKTAISKLIKEIELVSDGLFIDLGCGNGKLIRAVTKTTGIRSVGYENRIFQWIYAKFTTASNSKIKIIRGDLFDANISNASHIYCYLLPGVMERLESKINRECKSGTTIISCDFKFPNMIPVKIIDVQSSHYFSLSRKLFVYLKR